MKKLLLVLLMSCAVLAAAIAAPEPHAAFRKNYNLLQRIGAPSSYRDTRCLILFAKPYREYCKFFADSTVGGNPLIWAEMYHPDGTLWFEFTVYDEGSTLQDKQAYTKSQRKAARRFYRTLTTAAA